MNRADEVKRLERHAKEWNKIAESHALAAHKAYQEQRQADGDIEMKLSAEAARASRECQQEADALRRQIEEDGDE